MIFVTVGTQLPFDRLVNAVDEWALNQKGEEVVAQIGPTNYVPKNFAAEKFISPARMRELVERSSIIVSHAGMGSILTALRYRKPIIILPRHSALAEHRNDHQIATARWLGDRPGVFVAMDVPELYAKLDERAALSCDFQLTPYAPDDFTSKLKSWIGG